MTSSQLTLPLDADAAGGAVLLAGGVPPVGAALPGVGLGMLGLAVAATAPGDGIVTAVTSVATVNG